MKKNIFCLFFCLIFMPLYSAESRPTICLNMIVKDEKDVIERCLASTLPLIDYWVIVDTGSSDETPTIIKEFMKKNNVPGELHFRPWKNFAHNRNEAMQLAKGKADYLLFIDADEHFSYDNDFVLPCLDKDYYYIFLSHSETNYCRIHLINNALEWDWVGVLHELIIPPIGRSSGILEKVQNVYTTEGARSKDPEKYHKDAKILEEALETDPDNSRNVFYLAQSYKDAGEYELALKNYKRREQMGGWDQEVFWSLLQVAVLQEILNYPLDEVVQGYNAAYLSRMSRIEPLYHLARYYNSKNEYKKSYAIAQLGLALPKTKDLLFVQTWMYNYGMALELSVSAYWLGKYDECQSLSKKLLETNALPEHVQQCVEKNLGFANAKLLETICKK